MNLENLRCLVERYGQNFPIINDQEHDEVFKWAAVKQFQRIWFDPEKRSLPFHQLFKEAVKDSSVMIDNATVCPTNGIIKAAEQYPDKMRALFTDCLFVPDGGDLDARQGHIEEFIAKANEMIHALYPTSYKFPQRFRDATCYLALFAPAGNYIYRYGEASKFAKYVEFEDWIGVGAEFKLSAYYRMCDQVVEVLREYPALIDAHHQLEDSDPEKYYHDDSLHLMAFDLIYCCDTYGFYRGMTFTPPKEARKAYALRAEREREQAELAQQTQALRDEISELERQLDQLPEIDLVGVMVFHPQYGDGIVTEQSGGAIRVQFSEKITKFILHQKYPNHPRFENDEEIIGIFSERADIQERITREENEIKKLSNGLEGER